MNQQSNLFIIDSDILAAELLSKYHADDLTKKYLAFYKRVPLLKRVVADFILTEFELYVTNVIPARYNMQLTEKKQLHDIVASYFRQISMNCTLISPNTVCIQNGLSLYQQRTNDYEHVSFTDCLLLATAAQMSYTIITRSTQVKQFATDLHIPHFEPKLD